MLSRSSCPARSRSRSSTKDAVVSSVRGAPRRLSGTRACREPHRSARTRCRSCGARDHRTRSSPSRRPRAFPAAWPGKGLVAAPPNAEGASQVPLLLARRIRRVVPASAAELEVGAWACPLPDESALDTLPVARRGERRVLVVGPAASRGALPQRIPAIVGRRGSLRTGRLLSRSRPLVANAMPAVRCKGRQGDLPLTRDDS